MLGIAGPSWTVSRELNGNAGPFSFTTSNSIGTAEPAERGGARTEAQLSKSELTDQEEMTLGSLIVWDMIALH